MEILLNLWNPILTKLFWRCEMTISLKNFQIFLVIEYIMTHLPSNHRYYPNSKISIHLKFPSCLVKLSVERENIFSYVSSIPTCPTLMSDAFEVWLLGSKLWPYCTFLFWVALIWTILGTRKPKTTLADWDDFLNPNGTYCAILQQFFFVGTQVVEYVKLWVLHKKPLSIMWDKVIKKELSLKCAYFLRYILLFSYIFCICSTGSKRRIWALRFCPLYLPVIHNILLQVTLLL